MSEAAAAGARETHQGDGGLERLLLRGDAVEPGDERVELAANAMDEGVQQVRQVVLQQVGALGGRQAERFAERGSNEYAGLHPVDDGVCGGCAGGDARLVVGLKRKRRRLVFRCRHGSAAAARR